MSISLKSRSLALVHRNPDTDWTVSSMARKVGMSRSAFAARFCGLVGEPPNKYLTRWRMHLASNALCREKVTLAEVASRIGDSSEYAFSEAFKRFTGLSPSAFRRLLLLLAS